MTIRNPATKCVYWGMVHDEQWANKNRQRELRCIDEYFAFLYANEDKALKNPLPNAPLIEANGMFEDSWERCMAAG